MSASWVALTSAAARGMSIDNTTPSRTRCRAADKNIPHGTVRGRMDQAAQRIIERLHFRHLVSTTTKSAFAPGARRPRSSRPSAFAASLVAASNTDVVGTACIC